MRETVTLENEKGRVIGKADIISNPEHYPQGVKVDSRLFRFHRTRTGHLIYRASDCQSDLGYVPQAENFRR